MRPSKKRSKTPYIVAALVAAILIIAIVAVVYWEASNRPKPFSSQYFDVVPTVILADRAYGSTNNRTLVVKTLCMNVTPVLGDANTILFQVPSHPGDDESNQLANISRGVTHEFEILLEGYTTTLQNINGTDVYPVGNIYFASFETTPDRITLYYTPDQTLILGGSS